MTFSFNNYATNELRTSPLTHAISGLFGGYGKAVQSKYMPEQLQADIFHKTISPLAMLASSPFFSAMNPAQQQQIGSYISQMLSKYPGIGGQPGGMNGMNQGGLSQGSPMGQMGSSNYNDQQNPDETFSEDNGLVPNRPAEHFTQKFGESSYQGGTVHRDKEGRVISTPTGSQVERNQGILSGVSKASKLYNEYKTLAKEVAEAGAIKTDLSSLAGGVGKLPLGGFEKTLENKLGGRKLAEKAAKLKDLEAKLRGPFKEAGLTDGEIDHILHIRGGEGGESVERRLNQTSKYINQIAKQSKNVLGAGYNVSSDQKAIPTPSKMNLAKQIQEHNRKQADIEETVSSLKKQGIEATPEKVDQAVRLGIKTVKEFKDFLAEGD